MATLIPIVFGLTLCSCNVDLSYLHLIRSLLVGEIEFNTFGFIMAVTATASLAWLNVKTKQNLSKGISQAELLFFTDCVALALITPLSVTFEFPSLIREGLDCSLWFLLFLNSKSTSIPLFLIFSACGYVCQVYSAFLLLKYIAPLSYSICSVTKRVFIISGSILFLQKSITRLNLLGIFITFSGVFMYVIVKSREKKEIKEMRV